MMRKNWSSMVLVGLLVMAIGLAGSASATVVAADTFTLGGSRTVGTQLTSPQVTEVGGLTWFQIDGTNPYQFADGGKVVSGGVGDSTGLVDISGFTDTYYTVSIDANPTGSGFTGVRFNDTNTGMWVCALSFILFPADGGWEIHVNNYATRIANGISSDFKPNDYNNLKLAYNATDNTVFAWLNGVNILNGYDLDTISYTPDINVAGFMSFGGNGDTAVTNFAVNIVPEPFTLGLILVGFGGMAFRRRK